MNNAVINLFTKLDNNGNVIPIAGFEHAHEMSKKVKNKRIHYKYTNKHKYYTNYEDYNGNIYNDTMIYGRLNAVYTELANAFPFLFGENEYTEYGIIRSWKTEYYAEKYTFKGIEYKGQVFTVRQAEIIGTEDLKPDERLFIHNELLEAFKLGYNIEQCTDWLNKLIGLFKQGYRLCDVVLALLLLKGDINGQNYNNTLE